MNRAHRQASRLQYAGNYLCHADHVNCSSHGIDREERRRRALSVVGAFASGVDDLSVNHDQYLAEAYADAAGDECRS